MNDIHTFRKKATDDRNDLFQRLLLYNSFLDLFNRSVYNMDYAPTKYFHHISL